MAAARLQVSRHINANRNEKANRINTVERCTEIITNLANLDHELGDHLCGSRDPALH